MISLRNLPFIAVAIASLLFGTLVFNDCPYFWYVLTLFYLVLAFAFRKPIDTADGGHH